MTANKINMKNQTSGRNKHRFLIKESYRIFKARGYEVFIEYKFAKDKNYKADLFANGKERIVVECFIRPTLKVCQEKQKYRKYCDKLVLVYPKGYMPTFTLEDFFDEVIPVEVPKEILKQDTNCPVKISIDTRRRINILKVELHCRTHDEVINKALDLLQDLEEAR